jgi:hypothetical protein
MRAITVTIGVLLCLTLYMLPAGIGIIRGRSNAMAIFVLNLFLGWTLIGWVIALVWAVADDNKKTAPIQ